MAGVSWYTSRPEFRNSLQILRNYLAENEFPTENPNSYQGKRGAMVVDAVTSRQRKYNPRVLKIVKSWLDSVEDPSLQALVDSPLGTKAFGLRIGESESISQVAAALLSFGQDFSVTGDDAICKAWADTVEDFRFTPKLDPYVGRVDGIGIALFAYLRKLSGADAIKPDVRVRKRLHEMGFDVPEGSEALMLLCELLAQELGIDRSRFDDYLWAEPIIK